MSQNDSITAYTNGYFICVCSTCTLCDNTREKNCFPRHASLCSTCFAVSNTHRATCGMQCTVHIRYGTMQFYLDSFCTEHPCESTLFIALFESDRLNASGSLRNVQFLPSCFKSSLYFV